MTTQTPPVVLMHASGGDELALLVGLILVLGAAWWFTHRTETTEESEITDRGEPPREDEGPGSPA